MIEPFIAFMQNILIPLGAVGVFAAFFAQEIIAVIPASLVMLLAGFVMFAGAPFSPDFLSRFTFELVVPATLGATLGALFYYWIVYYFGRPAIERFGRYIGLSWHDIEKLNRRLTGGYLDEVVVVGLRAFPIFPNTAVSALCGLIRMNVWKYLGLTFLGLMIRIVLLGVIGWQAGLLYTEYAAILGRLEQYFLIGIGLIAVVCVVWLYLQKQDKGHPPDAQT